MIETTRLPNGLTVVSRHLPGRRSTALGVWLLNGVRHEAADASGYAHLLEHMLFKGTAELDAAALAARFDTMGGQINAYTGRELTALHGLVPTAETLPLLALFSAMLRQPRFEDHDLDMEKQVVLQEMAMVQDNPEEALEELATARAWAGHPLGNPILGARANLMAVSAADLRAYLSAQLCGTRLWVVAAGEIEHADLIAACADLGALPSGARPTHRPPRFHPGRHEQRADWEQSHLLWLLPTAGLQDPDYYRQLLANQLLGGGSASRLFQELRERRGLVYGIHSRLELYSDAGLWLIQTACDPAQRELCIGTVNATVTHLSTATIALEDLEIARRHLLAGLALEEDDLEGSMERLARESIYLGRHPGYEERAAALSAVTAGDVANALTRCWSSALTLTSA